MVRSTTCFLMVAHISRTRRHLTTITNKLLRLIPFLPTANIFRNPITKLRRLRQMPRKLSHKPETSRPQTMSLSLQPLAVTLSRLMRRWAHVLRSSVLRLLGVSMRRLLYLITRPRLGGRRLLNRLLNPCNHNSLQKHPLDSML